MKKIALNILLKDMKDGGRWLTAEEEVLFFEELNTQFNFTPCVSLTLVDRQSESDITATLPPFLMKRVNTGKGNERGLMVDSGSTAYYCDQVNFDFTIPSYILDAQGQENLHNDTKEDLLISQVKAIPHNIITTGFNGKTKSDTTDIVNNKSGQDIKEGWIEKIKKARGIELKNHDNTYESHNELATSAKKTLPIGTVQNSQLVCIVGDGFQHGGLENQNGSFIQTKKTLGNLPTYLARGMPENTLLITTKTNLVTVVQRGSLRATGFQSSQHKDEFYSLISMNLDYGILSVSECALLELI